MQQSQIRFFPVSNLSFLGKMFKKIASVDLEGNKSPGPFSFFFCLFKDKEFSITLDSFQLFLTYPFTFSRNTSSLAFIFFINSDNPKQQYVIFYLLPLTCPSKQNLPLFILACQVYMDILDSSTRETELSGIPEDYC